MSTPPLSPATAGLSEITLSHPSSTQTPMHPHIPVSTQRTVHVGKSPRTNTSPAFTTTTPLSSSATGTTSVNKIDITHDTSAHMGGAPPDRMVPMEDLNLLVDPAKTRTGSEPFSAASPITIQRTASPSVFDMTSVPSVPSVPGHAATLSHASSAPAGLSELPGLSNLPGLPGVSSLLDETTDLSDLLNKEETSDASFAFTPSINVSTKTAAPVAAAPVAATAPVTTVPAPAAAAPAATSATPAPGFLSSLFGGGGGDTPAPSSSSSSSSTSASSTSAPAPATPPPRPQTNTEIQKEKQDLLFKLNRLQNRGMPISRKYTMSSPLDDIRSEFLSLKSQRDIQNSVKFQRKMMMAVVTGVEFMNTKFDPFDVKLDGWSESVHENVDDYDEIFEELHDKYKEKAKMAPETKLFFSLAGSAFMFHLTQSLFKTSPGMGDVLQQNPELMKQFAQAAVGAQQRQMGGAAMGPPPSGPMGMPGGMPGGMGGMGGRQTPHNAQQSAFGGGGGGGLGSLFSGLMGGGGGGGGGGGLGDMVGGLMGMGGGGGSGSDAGSSYGASEVQRHQMSGPTGVDDILSQLSVPGGGGGGSSAPAPSAAPPPYASGASRLANVTRADESDIAQLGDTMRRMDTASSGYRKRLSDGMRLNL